jgi:hypothetical protein
LEQDEINTNEGDHNELVIETLRHQSQLNPEHGGDNPDRGEPALDIILPQLQPQPQPSEEMSDTTMPNIHTVISHNRSIPANKSSLMAHPPPVRDIYDIPPDEPIRQTRARPAPLRRSQPFSVKTHHLEQDEMQINKGNHNEPASHSETILHQPPSTREEQGNYQINDTTEHTNMGRHHGQMGHDDDDEGLSRGQVPLIVQRQNYDIARKQEREKKRKRTKASVSSGKEYVKKRGKTTVSILARSM